MQQVLSVWLGLDARRRIIVIGATLAMFAAVLGLSRMASQPSMSLLYAGLESSAAGEVVAALEQQNVGYEVRAGAIFVDSSQRDALRLTLAAEGLPANNGQGYELLDSLSGFGTTSQMFDAAYWRAKEGELARTITSNPNIQGARVHISNPSSNPFQRDLTATASVTVIANAGAVPPSHARALKYLVASAVAGLAPENVSVIDGRGGLVLQGDDPGSSNSSSEDRAVDLRRNIQNILEARVGFGKSVVEVSVETVTEREAIVERRFDPENRVAISSETEERSTSSSGSQGGAVTVASNLPEGDAAGGENSSRSENSETRERVNYEVSETTREVLRTPGAIKRITVAVLVDGLRGTDPETGAATWVPRPEEELASLRELVASTVGFDESRGDTITLKSLEFEPIETEITETPASAFGPLNLDAMSLLQMAVLAVVALILGLFVVRPILASNKAAAPVALIGPDGQTRMGLPGSNSDFAFADGGSSTQITSNTSLPNATARSTTRTGAVAGAQTEVLTGEIDDGSGNMPDMALMSPDDPGATGQTTLLDENGEEITDPVERLRRLIEERREETVEILRNWMEDHEEPA